MARQYVDTRNGKDVVSLLYKRVDELSVLVTELKAQHGDLLLDLKTQYNALLAKMDADFADVTNASVDYVASVPVTEADPTISADPATLESELLSK